MPRNPIEDALRKLRMNSMYGGMPDLDRLEELAFGLRDEEEMRGGRLRNEQESRQGRQMREKFKYDEIGRINEHNRGVMARPRLQQIAQSIAQPEIKPPMNVVFRDSITPYQQAQLGQKDKDRKSRESLAEQRIAQGDTKIEDAKAKTKDASSDRERRTVVLENKAAKETLTDKEKIELNALNAVNRAEKSAGAAMDRVNRGGELASDRQGVAGNQRLEQIAATIAGGNARQEDAQAETAARDIRLAKDASGRITQAGNIRADAEAGKATQMPNRVALERKNKVSELVARNPAYADYIKLEDDGRITISPVGVQRDNWPDTSGPTQNEHDQIVNTLFGTDPGASKTAPEKVVEPPKIEPTDKRARAILLLTAAKKLVNEQTIKMVMDRMK